MRSEVGLDEYYATSLKHTSVYDVVVVEIVDCLEHLADGLSSIFLCEFALFADAVEQLSTGR